jgi:glycosyltransferase involved in cell wall biosynthesis
MKIVMYPGVGVKNENRYIDILVNSLRKINIEVESWHKHLSFQKGDIFHVHWPEIISEIQARKYNSLRGKWISFQFFSTIKRIKKGGGRIVWTVHDLTPHANSLHGDVFFKNFLKRFIDEVDVALSLTKAGITQIKQEIPELSNARFYVAHHPHYREILKGGSYSQEFRKSLGIKSEQCVFSFLGSLRANKRPDLVASAFCNLSQDTNFLIMAGSASQDLVNEISSQITNTKNIKLFFYRIPERELIQLYSATDILVFPGTDYFNSGTIYASLSFNVPVIAAWSPTNAEIQELVGSEWIYLYKSSFSTEVLIEGRQALIKRGQDTFCDLSKFSPQVCAHEHLEAYNLKSKNEAA